MQSFAVLCLQQKTLAAEQHRSSSWLSEKVWFYWMITKWWGFTEGPLVFHYHRVGCILLSQTFQGADWVPKGSSYSQLLLACSWLISLPTPKFSWCFPCTSDLCAGSSSGRGRWVGWAAERQWKPRSHQWWHGRCWRTRTPDWGLERGGNAQSTLKINPE